jgi:alanine dehydrogenase
MGTSEISKHVDFVAPGSGALLMLGAAELERVLTPARCLAALEEAYRELYAAPADGGRSLGFQVADGKFHVKAGLTPPTHRYFAAKINANFTANPGRAGLPTIQGVIVLCDGTDGRPVAILQSGELTGRRTAAATAMAAKHGAWRQSTRLAQIGCGAQSRYLVQAVTGVLPIECITAVDIDADKAAAFAAWATETLGIKARVGGDIADAVAGSDIIVTCTTGAKPVIFRDFVPKGCFIAAVGADNPDKQELDAGVFTGARILVDDIGQCAEGGDLAHAIRAGTATVGDVAASLADLAGGAALGRTEDDEVVIFDSTGVGVQDVAAAAAAFEALSAP